MPATGKHTTLPHTTPYSSTQLKAMGVIRRNGKLANKEQFAVLRQSPELVVNPHL